MEVERGEEGRGDGKRLEVNRLYISQTPFQIYIFRHLSEEVKYHTLKKGNYPMY